ncbi:DUF6480 family protein [Streptomyces sp. NPDC004232]|uniref:DUF6480 family protein n=1 Tax=Streptomyces sp. NPDC004232 TaxID=3154454 RepID=UPI0033B3A45C
MVFAYRRTRLPGLGPRRRTTHPKAGPRAPLALILVLVVLVAAFFLAYVLALIL